MCRVYRTFERLRPVTVYFGLAYRNLGMLIALKHRRLEFRYRGLITHIDPDKTGRLMRGIGLVFNLTHKLGFRWFGWHIHHIALHIHFPAMIETAQTAFLVPAERQ